MRVALNTRQKVITMRIPAARLVSNCESLEDSTRFGQTNPRMFHLTILSLRNLGSLESMIYIGNVELQRSLVRDSSGPLYKIREMGGGDVLFMGSSA
jgi:hypothetical protein